MLNMDQKQSVPNSHLVAWQVLTSTENRRMLGVRSVTILHTVSQQTHVLRQPIFSFYSLFSAITIDFPRSCLVRTGVAYIGKPSICDPLTVSF